VRRTTRGPVAVACALLGLGSVAIAAPPDADRWAGLERSLAEYRRDLDQVRREHGGVRKMPAVPFFLFGMGDRTKLLYRHGVLRDARTTRVVRRWDVARELIAPPAYTVALRTKDGTQVYLQEDEQGVWLAEGGKRVALSRGRVRLPEFAGKRHGPVLRVLHQELPTPWTPPTKGASSTAT
jgi:hypothetical protein